MFLYKKELNEKIMYIYVLGKCIFVKVVFSL